MAEHKIASRVNAPEHRDSRRIAVNAPVQITATDSEGRQRSERTFIQDVSDFGCRFSLTSAVREGDVVLVTILGADGVAPPDQHPHPFEIMWVDRTQSRLVVGARVPLGLKREKIDWCAPNKADT